MSNNSLITVIKIKVTYILKVIGVKSLVLYNKLNR